MVPSPFGVCCPVLPHQLLRVRDRATSRTHVGDPPLPVSAVLTMFLRSRPRTRDGPRALAHQPSGEKGWCSNGPALEAEPRLLHHRLTYGKREALVTKQRGHLAFADREHPVALCECLAFADFVDRGVHLDDRDGLTLVRRELQQRDDLSVADDLLVTNAAIGIISRVTGVGGRSVRVTRIWGGRIGRIEV